MAAIHMKTKSEHFQIPPVKSRLFSKSFVSWRISEDVFKFLSRSVEEA